MQTQPLTSMNNMQDAIKKMKEEKKAREAEEKARKDAKEQIIIEETKKEVMAKENIGSQDVVLKKEDLERKRQELERAQEEKEKQQVIDDQIKN